jgi:tetratricopeptide (TPR) repeat protein
MMSEGKENRFQEIFLKSRRPFFWIALVIFIVYAATLFYNIVYLDDNVLITGSYQYNKDLSNIFQAFREDIFRTAHGGGSFYRPIERLSFMLDAQFGEGAVIFMSHFSNILLHIIAIWLLYIFLLKFNIKKETAFLLSLIFGVHPLTAQTVAFLVGRNDSLLAIFVFPSLIFLLKWLETQRRNYFFWHLIFFALALFTKETAAVLPAISLAYIIIFIGPRKILAGRKPYLYLLAGWGGNSVLWFLIRRAVLNNFIGNADYHITLSIYKNAPALIPAIGKIILPFQLSVFPVLKDMTMSYGIAVLALLAIWFVLAEKRNYKLIIFGVAWFFLFILLTLIKPMDTTPEFSENRVYIPMFGFIFIILGLGKVKFLSFLKEDAYKKTMIVLAVILIIIFSSVTICRNRYYKDKLNFWRNAVETSPSFAFNHNNLGAMYYLDGNKAEAEKEFRKALEINPEERLAHNNLGLIYTDRNEFPEAEQEFKKELENNPYYDASYFNLGLMYLRMGREDAAVENWKKALEVNPDYTDAMENLAVFYYNKKSFEEAAYYVGELNKRGIQTAPELQKLLNPFNFIQLAK